jgi:hypothetical protein
MGGLVVENIMTHARAALPSDPEPSLFANAALYQQVKDRTIAVISLGSAAGGSKAADLVNDPGSGAIFQALVGEAAQWLGQNSNATKSLEVFRASDFLAPIQADPGVPIYMVAGYSKQTAAEASGGILGILGDAVGDIPMTVFDGDQSLASLDSVVEYNSRSDGLVDFRSSCGVMSDDESAGLGYGASLSAQMQWCYTAPKKANHRVWFLINMNHYLLSTPWVSCGNSANPCQASDPSPGLSSFSINPIYYAMSAIEVVRAKLDANRPPAPSLTFAANARRRP